VFQKELYTGIPNVNVWRVLQKKFTLKDVQTIHRSSVKYQHFCSNRQRVTFGKPL
jgi:hypothetical protein